MEKEFEKEINNIISMKGILTYDVLVMMLTKIAKKQGMPIILRNKNIETNQTTIKVIA
ncbi:MAG TPA: hypothetical protein PKY25_00770 [Bacilli bacterium]|nr:hypothetical protein [Bacilli bacterium]